MDETTVVKTAVGHYLTRWYNFLAANTQAMQEFTSRGAAKSLMWVPDRMVDAVEEMLASYRKNNTTGVPGANAKFPVVLIAMSKDFSPVTGDWGRQAGDRMLVRLTDEDNASVYGYRQALMEARLQVALCATDSPTARSLATQFALFVGAVRNRTFYSEFQFGQYVLKMPIQIENPDIAFMSMPGDQTNVSILVGDLTLKITIPYLDAPKAGEPNDGSTNNPPGYPQLSEIGVVSPISAFDKDVIG